MSKRKRMPLEDLVSAMIENGEADDLVLDVIRLSGYTKQAALRMVRSAHHLEKD